MRTLIFLGLLIAVAGAMFRSSRPVQSIVAEPDVVELDVVEIGPPAVALDGNWANDLAPHQETVIPPYAGLKTDWLSEIHQKNDSGFRQTPGNGRTRGGAHVLLGTGDVIFITDSIRSDETNALLDAKPDAARSPYGLWGNLGVQQRGKAEDHEFERLARQTLKQQAIGHWDLQRIQLLSVDHQWAYDDDKLPTMKAIEDKSVGTRPLSAFETQSVQKLRRGEQLVIERSDDSIDMVGAIRASSKCLGCHAGQEHDLLGAFTYRLKRAEK